MLAKGKRKDNGKWITGYPFTYGIEDEWYFVPEFTNKLKTVPVEKKTICRYTGEMLSDGRRLHEYDKVEVKDTNGNKISGIIQIRQMILRQVMYLYNTAGPAAGTISSIKL